MSDDTEKLFDEVFGEMAAEHMQKKRESELSEPTGDFTELLVCDHEWNWVDESFDHEFGTEQAGHYECAHCGETKDGQYEPEYFDDDVI